MRFVIFVIIVYEFDYVLLLDDFKCSPTRRPQPLQGLHWGTL